MDRLTFDGDFCTIAMCQETPCPYDNSCTQREVWERLKEYEDTGLEPEEVAAIENALIGREIVKINEISGFPLEHLLELARAEKDGRLVVLPCKVGTPVWYVKKEIVPNGGRGKWKTQLTVESVEFDFSVLDWIDTPIYLSREEAEAARLRELQSTTTGRRRENE